MTSTADQKFSSSSIPKDFPETVETFADVLKLLQVDSLDVDEKTQNLAVRGAPELLARYGKEWFRENRIRLIEELELLNEM